VGKRTERLQARSEESAASAQRQREELAASAQRKRDEAQCRTRAQAAAPPATDPFEALQKLASLRDAGIVSAEEFEAKRQELLKRL
jgi:hypothetical protein